MNVDQSAIAVIGMAGRFPGAAGVDEFWANLVAGRRSLSRFDPATLVARGESIEEVADPRYVPVQGVLDDVARFDAELFGMSAREAEITDPQHRIALECAAAALEDAGHDPDRFPGPIAVFAGTGRNEYLLEQVLARPDIVADLGHMMILLGNEKDHIATRIAYRLGLRGPAITVQTACSTSLVAVHLACQSLRAGESDLALAGGVAVAVHQGVGYLYQEHGVLSPDGICRAFGRDARGVVYGSGVGLVVLRRLADALSDGDDIRAVIRGSAVNNDGAARIGYTAPGVGGQAAVIRAAHRDAGVDPAEIDYVEAHGVGTEIGDGIEVAALIDAFAGQRRRDAPCLLGSVKPNIGHLDVAAGISGLIKLVLSLRHGQIPPSLDSDPLNPEIPFADGPFEVNSTLRDWPVTGRARLGAVSSFGVGGTNAHLIVEEAPRMARVVPEPPLGPVLLPLSAHTRQALDEITARLHDRLRTIAPPPADVARTLRTGRTRRRVRRAVVWDPDRAAFLPGTAHIAARRPAIAMLLTGPADVRAGLVVDLYPSFAPFRDAVDECLSHADPDSAARARTALVGEGGAGGAAAPEWTTLFVLQFSVARLLESYGIRPSLLIGAGPGEYCAVCLAGGLSVADAVRLVLARDQSMSAADSVGLATRLPARTPSMPLSDVDFHALAVPVVCAATGAVLPVGTMLRPEHWDQHPRNPRPLRHALTHLADLRDPVVVRVGPDDGTAEAIRAARTQAVMLTTLPDFDDERLATMTLLDAIGEAWSSGIDVAWPDSDGRRVPLPTYPFGGDRHWLGPARPTGDAHPPGGGARALPFARPATVPVEPISTRAELVTAPAGTAVSAPDSILAPAEVAERVAVIWQAILGGDPPTSDTNFFDAGGDSLAAIQLLTKIRRTLMPAASLNIEILLERPTLGELVRAVAGSQTVGDSE
jgi:acyl transferase domain-containing protein